MKTNLPLSKLKSLSTLCLLALLAATTVAFEKDRPATPPVIPPNPNNLPKVLLIGDSTSAGYPRVLPKPLRARRWWPRAATTGNPQQSE